MGEVGRGSLGVGVMWELESEDGGRLSHEQLLLLLLFHKLEFIEIISVFQVDAGG